MSVPIQTTIPTNPEHASAEAAQAGAALARDEGAALEGLFDALLAAFGAAPNAEELAALAEEAEVEEAFPEGVPQAEESDLEAAFEEFAPEEIEAGELEFAQPVEGAVPPPLPVSAQPEQPTAAAQDATAERPESAESTAPQERAPAPPRANALPDVAAPPGPATPSEGASERSAAPREAAAAAPAEPARERAAGRDRPGHDTGQEQAASQARDARALETPRANSTAPFPEVAAANDAPAAPAANARTLEASGRELRALPELPAHNEIEIVRSTQLLARDGGGQARIQLVPPQLGQLDLRVTVTENAVQIQLSADRGQVAELLARHIPELRQLLQAQGLQLDRVDVDLKERDPSGERSHPGDRDESEQRGGATFERERRSAERGGHAPADWNAREAGPGKVRGALLAVDVRV